MTAVPPPTRGSETTRTVARTETRASSVPRKVRLRHVWRRTALRLRRAWGRLTHVVTPAGGFVASAAVLAAVLGASLGWIEAWAVAVAAALLLLVALPFLVGGRNYAIRIAADRLRVVAGDEVRLAVEITQTAARPSLPARAELPVGPALRELAIPALGAGGRTELPLAVPAPHRGVITVGPLTVARRDPVGLLRRELTWPDRHLVHVHPVTTALPPSTAGLVRDLEGDPSRRLTDADLSFHAVREYAHGDARRHIHWRSTAKTGTLMVRQYEESQTARTAVLFDANRAEYLSADAFELGVSVAASIGLQAVREGRERFVAAQWVPGRERSAIDGLEELPSRTPTQLLDAWARLTPTDQAARVERIARGLAESRRPLSLVAVVTGSRVDAGRLRRIAAVFPPDVAVLIVRCEPLADPVAHRGEAAALLTVGALGDLPQLLLRRGAA